MQVFIITSRDTHAAWEQWATDKELSLGGFPVQNLLMAGAGEDMVGALAHALPLIPGAMDGMLLVASLEAYYGPGLPLSQLLEHAVVRGKTTLVAAAPPPGTSLAGQAELVIDLAHTITVTGSNTNPKGGS